MSHVSTTTHYNLPIYGGTDIINPLTDFNGTNEAVDTAIYEVSQALASGVTDITDVKNKVGDASLDTASQNLSGAVNELKSAIDTQAGDITDVESNVGTLQSQMATTTGNITTLNTTVAGLQTEVSGKASQTAVNTLATKVGTDALITTADNLSGAVNELKNDIEKTLPTRTPNVSITGDGVKTLNTILTEIADAIDLTKLTPFATISCVLPSTNTVYNATLSRQGNIGVSWGYVRGGSDGSTYLNACRAIKTGQGSNAANITNFTGTAAGTSSDLSSAVGNGDHFDIYY